ncbi:DMT family transporter [Conexibacter sp. CPCC 206217]|uniref:DMT family transporter n=1 Tax=Conexibacter sp. CPCC 206217 TaxID=3064574 RepID=UPI002718475A|nr:DMT family transporter [Conexibacter sp. CPCC 206217]MDO8210073.1 DMT family transporter [Conexibacter sp. CPCC 206217]
MNVFPHISRERQGLVLCLLAALGFGTMAVFAKLAYAAGASVLTLLSIRFVIGAALLWGFAAYRGVARITQPRAAFGALGLGLFLYAAESGLYAGALTRIDASLGELLLFSYPAIVVVAAILLRRESPSRRRIGAVVIATSGVALVLAGGSTGAIDPAGVALALGAAVIYATYVLSADGLGGKLHPLTFSALVCSGAAISFTIAGTASGSIDVGALQPSAWVWIALIAVGSTAVAMTAFIAGVERLGASRTSIMSALDPVVAIVAGGIAFGERLGPIQIVGALLVVTAVLVLQMRGVAELRRGARAGVVAAGAAGGRAGRGARAGVVAAGGGLIAPMRRIRGAHTGRESAVSARTAARADGCEEPIVPIPSRDRGASAQPAPQPSAGSLALVTSERQ